MTQPQDLLDCSLRDLLARVLDQRGPALDPDRWIDCRDAAQCPVPWRLVVEAAQRGELEASRVGRNVVVRARELDRWLSTRRITPAAKAESTAAPAAPSRAELILERSGYRKTP